MASPRGGASVPEVPEFDDAEWLPYEVKKFEIATCIQEMAENDADFAHFKFVHGSPEIPDGEVVIDGALPAQLERVVHPRELRARLCRAANRRHLPLRLVGRSDRRGERPQRQTGALQGQRLYLEQGYPAYQNLDGPQLGMGLQAEVNWAHSF